jgi:hypothetical protein
MADPTKLKVAREPVKKFKDYVTAMLKMTDGVVNRELLETHIINPDKGAGKFYSFWHSYMDINGENYSMSDAYSFSFNDEVMKKIYGHMSETDEGKCMELYPKLLVLMAMNGKDQTSDGSREMNVAQAMRTMDKVVTRCNDTTREVQQVVTKPVDNCIKVVTST